MAKLTCLKSVSQWEDEQTFTYPVLRFFIDKLKRKILDKPESGFDDPILSRSGKIIPCKKQSVNIGIFSRQYAIGYNFLTVNYIYEKESSEIIVVRLNYS